MSVCWRAVFQKISPPDGLGIYLFLGPPSGAFQLGCALIWGSPLQHAAAHETLVPWPPQVRSRPSPPGVLCSPAADPQPPGAAPGMPGMCAGDSLCQSCLEWCCSGGARCKPHRRPQTIPVAAHAVWDFSSLAPAGFFILIPSPLKPIGCCAYTD